jgi:hypothetical protein
MQTLLTFFTKQATLMRRSTVLSLPLWLVFHEPAVKKDLSQCRQLQGGKNNHCCYFCIYLLSAKSKIIWLEIL